MLKFSFSDKAVIEQKKDGLVFFLEQDFSFDKQLTTL